MQSAALTDTGRVRSHNEDTIFCTTNPIGPLPNLFIVADGMGGHNAGEVASRESVEYSCDYLRGLEPAALSPEEALKLLVEAVDQANMGVYVQSLTGQEMRGMGTTFSACTILGTTLVIAHIGDSRIYSISPGSPGSITQLTTDHTYVAEMIKAGYLTPENAKTHPNRSQLTRVLGYEPEIQVDGALHELNTAETVLLCSDGLTDMLTNDEIMNIICTQGQPQARAQALIDAANNNGGIDNISVIIIDMAGEPN